MTLGQTIETAIRKLVEYCHSNTATECLSCPFHGRDGESECGMNMTILEDLVRFTDTEIIPKKAVFMRFVL